MKILEIIKIVIDEIKNFTTTMNPVYTGGVTMYQVKQLLKKEGIKPVKIEIGDLIYKTIKFTDLLKFLRYNSSRLKKYQKRKVCILINCFFVVGKYVLKNPKKQLRMKECMDLLVNFISH